MGVKTTRQSLVFSGDVGVRQSVETLTSTGSNIGQNGVTILAPTGTTADKTFSLPRPTNAGVLKYIWCNSSGARKVSVTVAGATASGHFAGTTARTLNFSTNSTKRRHAELIAVSTSQWMLVSSSTGVSLVA